MITMYQVFTTSYGVTITAGMMFTTREAAERHAKESSRGNDLLHFVKPVGDITAQFRKGKVLNNTSTSRAIIEE